jgi:hypothetical protein
VPVPPVTVTGDLPPGVHRATLAEVVERFGHDSAQRHAVAERLTRIYHIARDTGHLVRFVVFGSFVTIKAYPNDVDIFMIMDEGFDLEQYWGETRLVFEHGASQTHFGASVFWQRNLPILGSEDEAIEDWQITRERRRRGIVEVISEDS